MLIQRSSELQVSSEMVCFSMILWKKKEKERKKEKKRKLMLKCFENGSIKKAAIAKSILITIDSLFLGPVYMEVGTPGGEVARWPSCPYNLSF